MSANISKINNSSIASRPVWASWLGRLSAASMAFLARLTPSANVRLIHADGTSSVWRVGATPAKAQIDTIAQFEAREIPESLFLSRRLVLPRMSAENTEAAILLEVRTHSPFATDDLAWGFAAYESDGSRQVDVVLASRKQIETFLQTRSIDLPSGPSSSPEIWAVAGLRMPVVLQGYGESARLYMGVQGRRWNYGLLTLATLLVTTIAVTPTVQLNLRAAEALGAFGTLMARATPLIRKRDELSTLTERLHALEVATAEKVDVPLVMEYLTKALPDDTYLYSLDVKSGKVVASGHTVDASALLQRLSNDSRLRDVKSPLAVTRQPGATKEAFTVEFTMAASPSAVVPPVATAARPAGQPAPANPSLPFTTGGPSK